MKKILLLLVAFCLIACCDGPAKSRRTGEAYYPVKVCSIGDVTGESCVEYAAKSYCSECSGMFIITTLDGHKYSFNHEGWSIIVTKK